MKLWKISQDQNNGWDTYDSAVVAAEDQEAARLTHPARYIKDWSGKEAEFDTWCDAEFVTVEYLGEAAPNTEPGVIVASFNAG